MVVAAMTIMLPDTVAAEFDCPYAYAVFDFQHFLSGVSNAAHDIARPGHDNENSSHSERHGPFVSTPGPHLGNT